MPIPKNAIDINKPIEIDDEAVSELEDKYIKKENNFNASSLWETSEKLNNIYKDTLDESYRDIAIAIANKKEWNIPINLIANDFIKDENAKTKYISFLNDCIKENGGRFNKLKDESIKVALIHVHHIVFRTFGQKELGLSIVELDSLNNLIALTAEQHLAAHELLVEELRSSLEDKSLYRAAVSSKTALAQHKLGSEDLTSRQMISYLKNTYLDASNNMLTDPNRGKKSKAPGHYLVIYNDDEPARLSLQEIANILEIDAGLLKWYLDHNKQQTLFGESEEIELAMKNNDIKDIVVIKQAPRESTTASAVLLIKSDLIQGNIRTLNYIKDILKTILDNSTSTFELLSAEAAHTKLITDGWCWFPTKSAADAALGRLASRGKRVGDLVNSAKENIKKHNKWFNRENAIGDRWDGKLSTDYKFYALPADEESLNWMRNKLNIPVERNDDIFDLLKQD